MARRIGAAKVERSVPALKRKPKTPQQQGSVASGSNFSAALRYDYKAFAVAAGYVKLKDMATSPALGAMPSSATRTRSSS